MAKAAGTKSKAKPKAEITAEVKEKEVKKMKNYHEMTKEELQAEKALLDEQYKHWQSKGLKLDMSRGKPSSEQLDLSMPIFDILDCEASMRCLNGVETRNYGGLEGLVEARKMMSQIMDCDPEQVIIGGNSSLNMMFDTVIRGYSLGFAGCTPWCKLDKVKWLCPVPGYDRHFAITQHFGFEMINIPMDDNGPDMDMVEKLVSEDDSIKGMWCVPKYSNPTGIIYSDEVVKRIASLKPAAKDFRVFWDNAYAVHHLYDEKNEIPNILALSEDAGNESMVFEFASTSKITFAGAGVAAMAMNNKNREEMKKTMTVQTIGYDKVNQLRHARFFTNVTTMDEHMKKHASLLRPRFELVLEALERDLRPVGCGDWIAPRGGYFITYNAPSGTATRIVDLCGLAGVVLTPAGAPFPYHMDPDDSVIRFAPSFPSLEELKDAADIFTVCARIATVAKLLHS